MVVQTLTLGMTLQSRTQSVAARVFTVSCVGLQRKRVTTGEMMVGGRRTMFMDEVSTGLDAQTTYLIVKCIANLASPWIALLL